MWPQALCWDINNQWVTTAGIPFPNMVRLVGYSAGTSMTVNFDAATGYATWNRSGNTVLLQI